MKTRRPLFLFDVDGTLTTPRNRVTPRMLEFLAKLSDKVCIGIVGGSDLKKIQEQLGENLFDHPFVDFVFAENGLDAYTRGGVSLSKTSISQELGEENLKRFINRVLHMVADLDLPIKRGTFVEFRKGMLNVSPIGRNCSQQERDEFERYDRMYGIRASMIGRLQREFPDLPLTYSIGGQISFDVFPRGWDKTYCLRFVDSLYEDIYFFGDKTFPGGNDYEIFSCPRVKGYTVASPEDTMEKCLQVLKSL